MKIENSAHRLVLASASPRRAELLRHAGIDFEVQPADVDETVHPGETAELYARRVARAKAHTIARLDVTRVVLGADTVVVTDEAILGKPRDMNDARRMLRMLSGRRHDVLTGLCLVHPLTDRTGRSSPLEIVSSARTMVEFAALSESELDWYVASGEPLDKAGAYAIQGLAARFVTRIDGSYSNVVGLPVALVYQMCRGAGILVS